MPGLPGLWRAVVLLLMAAVPMGGCVAAPGVHVDPPRLAETTEHAAVLVFTIQARNDGPRELPLRMVDYALEIDGRKVFDGRRSAEATLSANDQQRVELPVPIRWEDLPQGPVRYRLRGRLGYTLPGIFVRALFDAGLYRPQVGFALRGELDGRALRGGDPGQGP
ncbi:MAG: hypothetical protein KatS3mg103_0837 [Phycisphaerales bacterium]|nr:MAG: hypothetical protein KatS3mg103_0837 [Phycisphaerales bacterium]